MSSSTSSSSPHLLLVVFALACTATWLAHAQSGSGDFHMELVPADGLPADVNYPGVIAGAIAASGVVPGSHDSNGTQTDSRCEPFAHYTTLADGNGCYNNHILTLSCLGLCDSSVKPRGYMTRDETRTENPFASSCKCCSMSNTSSETILAPFRCPDNSTIVYRVTVDFATNCTCLGCQ